VPAVCVPGFDTVNVVAAPAVTAKLAGVVPVIEPCVTVNVVDCTSVSVMLGVATPEANVVDPGYVGGVPIGLFAGPENASACAPV
jgi:hypothetical protein